MSLSFPGTASPDTGPISRIPLDESGFPVALDPGATLFEAGAKAATLYYVVSGQLKAARSTDVQSEDQLGAFERGDVLGFSLGPTLPYTATATEVTKLYGYPSRILACALLQSPEAADALARHSLAPMASVLALHAICRSARPTPRIANYLLALFDRHGERVAGVEVVELPARSADMADRLGVSPNVVRSALTELSLLGIVTPLHGCWLRLCNRECLETMALSGV